MMENYPVKQIWPNHADHISYYKEEFIRKLCACNNVIAQPKYDGERMLIHIDNGHVYCTSRRLSKKTGKFMENQDKLPILEKVFENFPYDYTVIDCECYAKDWSTIVGILHSLPDRAIELQKQDTARFACFDCLWFDGQDCTDIPYIARLHRLEKVLEQVDYEPMHMVKMVDPETGDIIPLDRLNGPVIEDFSEIDFAMNAAINKGFEGIVLKPLEFKYWDKAAVLKCKKFETVDCVVCGYQDGRGKYAGTVGALLIGYYDPEKNSLVQISKVNCTTDENREFWNNNREGLLNTVIEVKCQEITDKSLRHPVLLRIREDKDYRLCTRDTIFK